ncbi:TlpA disulfide reductase family protein [Nocardioides ferulae]|uniref:TlpA disulfide reductase family protein n=1 Tax=Nocardioides ferulae TaxID=2340821 RepID=UPI000EAFDD00|nr:TlpA disulfide reductase family protein [Nocardioides ferulae]
MRHPRPGRAARLLAGLLLGGLLLSGCGDNEGTNDGGYISGDGSFVQYAEDDRSEPVELAGETLQGDALDVADLRGAPVVVNVWWSLCGPCRVEMPMLVEAAAELEGEAAFIGVNIRDASPENGLSFERSMGVDYPTIYDPSGEALLAFAGKVNPRTIPTTIVLDPEGRIAAVVNGPIPSKRTLVGLVEDAAEGASGGTGEAVDG